MKMNPDYWLFHPDIYPQIKDDRVPDKVDLTEYYGNCIFHYYPGGLVVYHKPSERWQAHPYIHPSFRSYAKQWCMDSIYKMQCDLECCIPVCFRHVIIFALQCGFKKVSKVENNYLRDGMFYDSILMVRKWAS